MPSIKIVTGDALETLRRIKDNSIDCVVTDPPYGQTSLVWDKPVHGWANEVARVLKPTGSMWVFGSLRHFMVHAAEFAAFRMSHDVVWEKHNGTGLFNDRFRRVHEQAAHFYRADAPWKQVYKLPIYSNDVTKRTVRKKQKPAHWIGATSTTIYESQDGGPRLVRSVIYARSEHGRAEHPTQKPLDLVDLLMRYACPPGGIVLDPFAGSGTTGLAARNLNRNAVLIELNPEYVEIARRRLGLDK